MILCVQCLFLTLQIGLNKLEIGLAFSALSGSYSVPIGHLADKCVSQQTFSYCLSTLTAGNKKIHSQWTALGRGISHCHRIATTIPSIVSGPSFKATQYVVH